MNKAYLTFWEFMLPVVTLLIFIPFQLQAAETNKYLNMSLEDLLSTEVSSVSRKQELLKNAGAAVFVISAEDIRRSGVSSIPEALRMAPGVNVARINSNQWAISARGFNGRFANKLLVQIDGRTVYTPSFSGVYWDVQDLVLEDIDQIEVIRGPGATLWGSNAVNGVVNIITKQAIDTQGGLLVAAGGTLDKSIGSLRYGGAIGSQAYGRGYVKYHKTGQMQDNLTGAPAGDGWDSLRGGFRVDMESSARNAFTIQGDIYKNKANQFVAQLAQPTPPYVGSVADAVKASGLNALVRWEHKASEENKATLQAYFDRAKRDEVFLGQYYDTVDVDFQHAFSLNESQQVIWGLGYRSIKEKIRNSFAASVVAPNSRSNVYSGFIQDNIELGSDALHLILGSKFEHNDYTGWEVQPNARMTWSVDDSHTIWAAASRAVHTPSRVDTYGRAVAGVIPAIPPFIPVATPVYGLGSTNLKAESLIAYEVGYRTQPNESLNVDVALFYNTYDNLRSFEPVPGTANVRIDNKIKGYGYGAELATDWQAQDWWQIRLAYSFLTIKLHTKAGSTDTTSITTGESSSPKQQVSLRSSMTLLSNVELDVWGRYNSPLKHRNAGALVPGTQAPAAYTELDIKLGWKPRENIELAITGQNLLHARHMEFIQETSVQLIRPTSAVRSVYGKVTLQF